MGTAADWQASSVQVAGLMKQVRAKGLEARVLARCSPATRAVFEQPFSARWHSGEALVEFSEAIVSELGGEGFIALNADMARASFGPILRPMLQVALALTGRSPATLLARVPTSIEQALRHVNCTWTSHGPKAGTLAFVYPCDIKPETELAWRGALRFLEELAGQPIRIDRAEVTASAVVLHVSWDR